MVTIKIDLSSQFVEFPFHRQLLPKMIRQSDNLGGGVNRKTPQECQPGLAYGDKSE